MLAPAIRRVLDEAPIAHLATIRRDGSPHSTPVYIGTHHDYIAVFTGPTTHKARNLARDPRVAISIAPTDNPFEPVVIRGRVIGWMHDDEAWDVIDRLAAEYTGAPYPRDHERVVALIAPEHQSVGVG